jgi:pyridoxal phosphate phosphatase PHOSPHO2
MVNLVVKFRFFTRLISLIVLGMLEFFQHIRLNKKAYECIIISDSNSLFIWYIVHYGHLEDIFPSSCIYTNPARLDEKDCLRIDYHHHNTTCPISADNLCKGRVLKEHIDKNVGKYDGKKYRTVVFVGDGLNDYCPSLRLSPSDYVAARREHKLLAKITQNPSKVQARLVPWTDGSDLLAFIHNLEKCHA